MEVIRNSFFDVIRDTINEVPKESIIPLKRGYLSKIGMLGTHNEVYLLFNKAFLELMSEKFLNERYPSEQALQDMAKELANLTVGRAKVRTQELGKQFDITTPEYLGHKLVKNYDHGLHFRLYNGRCSIYMRRTY